MQNAHLKWIKTLGISLLLFLLIPACVSDKKAKHNERELEQKLDDEFIDLESSAVNFKIPTPMEVFTYMKYNGAKYIQEAVNNPDNHKNYSTRKSKALNLGVYSADLAYCCIYEDYQNSITYFDVAKLLASELGLNQGYGNKMAERVNKNLNNIDSLTEIAASSYYEANLFLEDQGMSNLLGYILIGGWVETLHLGVEAVKLEPLQSPNYERIADQRFLLENLLAFLKTNSLETDASDLYTNLNDLSIIYDELNFNDENILITHKQFVDIANKATQIRNIIIR